MKKISERTLERRLGYLLDRVHSKRNNGWTRSFEESGVLTSNRGLVLTLGNGQEFQITIVESTRRPISR